MASGASRRYAEAVFSLAQEQETVEQWSDDLAIFKALVSDSDTLRYLNNPRNPLDEKLAYVDRALESAQPEARRLAHMVVERHRLAIVAEMVDAFEEAVLRSKKISVADVTTAVEMTEATEQAVREKLQSIVGHDVDLRTRVDPSIVGGIVVRVGDNLIDGSVSSQLRRMRERLTLGQ